MRKKPETERKQILAKAESVGLSCETTSPGDGPRRFKFYVGDDTAGKRLMFFASGIKEARIFLYGVEIGEELKDLRDKAKNEREGKDE